MADNSSTPKAAQPRAAKAAAPTSEARTHFSAAVDEAKAGAAALSADARGRATAYAGDARARGEDWAAEARTKAGDIAAEAKIKAGELATEGKNKAGEALVGLSRVVEDNTAVIDEKLGQKYGDYARSASRSLSNTATTLQNKSVEDLGVDAREYVRENPGKSLGIAVVAGYLISRLFRR